MPNHITTILNASSKVIDFLAGKDSAVDFNNVLPCHPDLSLNNAESICSGAETLAKATCAEPLHKIAMIAGLEASNRANASALDLDNRQFEQFLMMVKNKRTHGRYHSMNFTNEVWGTKWNAYDCHRALDEEVSFDTAWGHPFPVIEALSKKFPDEPISVKYADEDTGSNCGTYSILNGEVTEQDIAPNWSNQTPEEKAKWMEFAVNTKYGPDEDPAEYGCDINWNFVEE